MMARARLSAALALLAAPQVASAQPAPDPAPPAVAPAPPAAAPAPPTVAPAPPVATPAPPAAPSPLTFVIAKLTTTLYGYLEGNFKYDSTQSCVEFCGGSQVQRSGTYRGDHGRTIFSARDSRLGLRLAAPEHDGIRVSGVLETDFFGPTTTTEQSTYVNPVLRIRTSFLKIETPVLDVLVGQQWTLFGWQPSFISASVQYPGLPGETFERTPQLRLSKTIKSDAVTTELAVAANRPPQQDSATPEGVAGIRLSFNRWTGQHTTYMANTAIQPASLGISGDVRGFRIPELAVAQHHGIARIGGGVALDAYLPIIPATAASKDNALSLNGEVSITSGMSDAFTAVGAAGTANALVPPATPGGAPTPYPANFDPGLAAIDAAGHAELIKWIGYFASLEFYPAGTDGRVGLVANYGHMESSNAHSVGAASAAGSTAMAAAAAAARVRDHEDLLEIGGFVDPTRQTRIAASGSRYADTYGDGATANNYSVIVSAWLFF